MAIMAKRLLLVTKFQNLVCKKVCAHRKNPSTNEANGSNKMLKSEGCLDMIDF